MAQNPSSGQKVDTGSKVELLVCTGGMHEGMQNVPDLRGKTVEDATRLLQKLELVAGDIAREPSSAKEGTVISTKPNIGTRVQAGTIINLVVSGGAEEGHEPVVSEQNVAGESIVKAVKAEPKEPPQKKEKQLETKQTDKKTETKTVDKKQENKSEKTDTKAVQVKTDAKKADAKSDKIETKTSQKPAEIKAEVKAEPKKEAKAETNSANKTSEVKAETKQEPKKETKAETKPETATQQQTQTKVEAPSKSGKVRYTIPPLTSPLSLKIIMQDAQGSHVLQDTTVKESKTISVSFKYKEKANVSVILGGETVWQENYK